jgi:hypothetical protein
VPQSLALPFRVAGIIGSHDYIFSRRVEINAPRTEDKAILVSGGRVGEEWESLVAANACSECFHPKTSRYLEQT